MREIFGLRQGLTLAIVLLMTGCAQPMLIKEPIKHSGGNWSVEVSRVQDKVGYGTSGLTYYPPEGHRFIRVDVKIKNNAVSERNINLAKITLENNDVSNTPSFVDMNVGAIFVVPASAYPKLSPNEEISRKLIFSFPNGTMPNKISIKGLGTILLPLKK